MCVICSSSLRLEVDGALQSGLSMNEVSRRFDLNRFSVQKHARECLALRYDQPAEERKLADAARKRHEGRLEDALESARKLEATATAKGDTETAIRATREISKILALMDRAVAKQTVPMTATKKQDMRPRNWVQVGIFPEDCDPEFAHRFGGVVKGSPEYLEWERSLPRGALNCIWEIKWQTSNISALDRPMPAPDTDPGPDAVAKSDAPDQVAVEPEGTE
jgi:hypothetical protein